MRAKEIKAAVRERDGRCVDCGAARSIGKTGTLEAHRLVPGSEYTLDGCATLCRGCHAARHWKHKRLAAVSLDFLPDLVTPEYLIELRKSLGLTMQAFGDKLGVKRSTVCYWEKGKSHPRFTVLEKINVLAATLNGNGHAKVSA